MYSASLAVSQICLRISACNDSFFLLRSVFVPARCRLGTAFSLALARFPSCAVCVCVFFFAIILVRFFPPVSSLRVGHFRQHQAGPGQAGDFKYFTRYRAHTIGRKRTACHHEPACAVGAVFAREVCSQLAGGEGVSNERAAYRRPHVGTTRVPNTPTDPRSTALI